MYMFVLTLWMVLYSVVSKSCYYTLQAGHARSITTCKGQCPSGQPDKVKCLPFKISMNCVPILFIYMRLLS